MKPPDIFDMQRAVLASSLPPRDRHVLLTMLTHARKPKFLVWASVATIASETGYAQSTVHLSLKSLKDTGWLQLDGYGSPNGGDCKTVRYRLTPPVIGDTPSGKRRGSLRTPETTPPVIGDKQTNEQREEQTNEQSAVAFLLELGVDPSVIEGPKVTPERLAYVASVAKTKDNPPAWAADNLRKGWPIPSKPVTTSRPKRAMGFH